MFGERLLKNSEEEEITTLLDQGAQFEGKLTFDGSVQINGKFRGEIFSNGHLFIGEGADVEATIEVNSISIDIYSKISDSQFKQILIFWDKIEKKAVKGLKTPFQKDKK